MKWGYLAALLSLAPFPAAAQTGGVFTGNDLKKVCDSDQMGCIMYVMGSADSWTVAHYWYKLQPACYPNGAIIAQRKAILIKFLNDHPEMLHQPAGAIYVTAMSQAFPCPKEPTK